VAGSSGSSTCDVRCKVSAGAVQTRHSAVAGLSSLCTQLRGNTEHHASESHSPQVARDVPHIVVHVVRRLQHVLRCLALHW
jgi:hypothetical protein